MAGVSRGTLCLAKRQFALTKRSQSGLPYASRTRIQIANQWGLSMKKETPLLARASSFVFILLCFVASVLGAFACFLFSAMILGLLEASKIEVRESIFRPIVFGILAVGFIAPVVWLVRRRKKYRRTPPSWPPRNSEQADHQENPALRTQTQAPSEPTPGNEQAPKAPL